MTGKGQTRHVDSNGCRNKGTIQMYKLRQTDGYVNQTMDDTTDKGTRIRNWNKE